MKTFLAILPAAAVVLACGADHPQSSLHVDLPGTAVAVTEIRTSGAPPPAPARASGSGFTEPARLVIRSQEEWASTWALIHGSASTSPLPPVDFGADMVVVAATGTRGSTGYDITIPDAALDAGTLRVGVVETTPGSGCVFATVLTSPVAAARVPRHDGPVEFVDKTVAIACQ
ncbi:protease complex subunit PrcB family protein [Anaeromyxobacter oryzae]|uniref:PrcB C-terminal domain-containing protein n=1 Tax=Anaeromyxobacter oryzae TaxID=2918170 RepID=A0ABN6MXQ9_9BACT|nr:protease complex subunit PrcB family protein [Anaeromyxobacter oryzae]BDG05723.1 hypothetical protein AMOR_47190 [Anaeromyxobacter oryzae]